MNQIRGTNWLPHLQKCKFPVAITYFCIHFSFSFVERCRNIVKTMSAVAANINWKEGNALQSDCIKRNNKHAENSSFTGMRGSAKSQTLQRSRCLTRTNWLSADIFPHELKAKCWVYLWKQTGPYISPGITEISCINTGSFCCSQQPPSSALVQTWGKAIVIQLSRILNQRAS